MSQPSLTRKAHRLQQGPPKHITAARGPRSTVLARKCFVVGLYKGPSGDVDMEGRPRAAQGSDVDKITGATNDAREKALTLAAKGLNIVCLSHLGADDTDVRPNSSPLHPLRRACSSDPNPRLQAAAGRPPMVQPRNSANGARTKGISGYCNIPPTATSVRLATFCPSSRPNPA